MISRASFRPSPLLPPGAGLLGRLFAVTMATMTPAAAEEMSDAAESPAVTAFGGVMTDNNWEDVLTPWELEVRESGLAGIAASRRLVRFGENFEIEIEAQLVRHFGDQDHWEFNLPIIARWRTFPWDDVVDTSFAWGIGPSYATRVPQVELDNNDSSQRALVYWVAELELAPPDSAWSGIFRLHHRSDAFGLVADDGGSNALVFGLRRRF